MASPVIVTQQRQIARALLRDQNIAVGQHKEPARVGKPGGKRSSRRSLPGRHATSVGDPARGDDQHVGARIDYLREQREQRL